MKSRIIKAPFNSSQVQSLNEAQLHLHVDPLQAIHPFTCANRGDGEHGDEGGDLGVLIATPAGWGWVCPHCDHTQGWAHDAMAIPLESSALSAPKIAARLRAYEALYHANNSRPDAPSSDLSAVGERRRNAVETMLACLRRAAMAAEGVETRPGWPMTVTGDWVCAETGPRPIDGQRVDVLMHDESIANPNHPGFGPAYWVQSNRVYDARTRLLCLMTEPGNVTHWRPHTDTSSAEAKNDWARGYYAAVALLLREEGCVTPSVHSLYQQGGGAEFADDADAELFRAHGLNST